MSELADRAKAAMEDAQGKVKEATGHVTGNEDLEAEGNVDQAKADGHNRVADVKEGMSDAKDKVKDALD